MVVKQADSTMNPKETKQEPSLPRSKFFPFDDELSFKFYKISPSLSSQIVHSEEYQQLLTRDRMDLEELMEAELKVFQQKRDLQESQGDEVEPLPDEESLKQIILKKKERCIRQWCDISFD